MDTVKDTIDSFRDFFISKIQTIRDKLDTITTTVLPQSPASTDVSGPSHNHSLDIFQEATEVEILNVISKSATK